VSKQWWFRKREEIRVLRRVMYMKRVENREQNLENVTGGIYNGGRLLSRSIRKQLDDR